MEDVLVPVVMFMMVLGIVVAVQAAGTIRRENVLKTVRQAMQSGQTVTPEIIQALGVNRVNTKAKDIKSGLVLMAIAVALIIFGQTLNMTIQPARRLDCGAGIVRRDLCRTLRGQPHLGSARA